MVEGAGSGMAGVRDDFQQRVERRTPSVVGQMRFHGAEAVGGLEALPGGRAPGGRGQGGAVGPWGLHSERSPLIKGDGGTMRRSDARGGFCRGETRNFFRTEVHPRAGPAP